MAEKSGFFQSEWDSELLNPITEEYTGYWDRSYVAREFADYFKLFIGNGVFNNPVNQLKILPGEGLAVIVTSGWAFINGMWYHNDSDKEIVIQANNTANSRTDSIRVRFSDSLRTITTAGFTGDTTIIRGDNIYDLKLADITVDPLVTSIAAAKITDTRSDDTVCGFVRGLMQEESGDIELTSTVIGTTLTFTNNSLKSNSVLEGPYILDGFGSFRSAVFNSSTHTVAYTLTDNSCSGKSAKLYIKNTVPEPPVTI